ncbi:MAG: hypothetical protein JWN61_2797 [Pseudonocardiales bacterium]|nr:hypothetical protein [Pseudonocardiales bacterium]
MNAEQRPEDPVAVLRHWEQFGGLWQVTARDGPRICVSLCRCDNGEVVQRLSSDAPELAAWLDGRSRSD